jgi:alkanesulfonate monooxygenase SsuD/methylene tetrahydromethanopterin reductase-like flavin-dependent oxidoreductase (luciferase family)
MGKVRFGVIFSGFPEDGGAGTIFQDTKNYLAELPKEFESAWMPDHFIREAEPYSTDRLECLITISYLLPLYPYLKFGPIVLCNNYRNPSLLAKMSATLQVLSGDRVILGIGAGWYEEEYNQYGYEFPSPRIRIKQLEEAVQIIKMLWRENGATFHGKYYQILNAYCNPKPDPAPPIMIAGRGERFTLRVVAKYADWWNGYRCDPKTYTHLLNVLANHCDYVGTDYDAIVKTAAWNVALASSDEEATKLAKQSVERLPFTSGTYLIGSPESIVSQMGELIDAGVEYFQLYFAKFPNKEATQLFADEVISELT